MATITQQPVGQLGTDAREKPPRTEQSTVEHGAKPPIKDNPRSHLVYLALLAVTMVGVIALNVVLGWGTY